MTVIIKVQMETPPRFTIDNSPEARRQRMRQWAAPKVSEIAHRYVLGEPEGFNDHVVHLPRYVLGPLNNVVGLDYNPEPPDQAA